MASDLMPATMMMTMVGRMATHGMMAVLAAAVAMPAATARPSAWRYGLPQAQARLKAHTS